MKPKPSNPTQKCGVSFLLALGLSSSLVFPATSWAQAGELDGTFGIGGRVLTPFDPILYNGHLYAYDVAIQPDGKLVVVGEGGPGQDMMLARYAPDGNLDTRFGNDATGFVFVSFDDLVPSGLEGRTQATTVAIQPDGRIVVGGSHSYKMDSILHADLALARYNGLGTLDRSFGDDGRVLTDLGRRIDKISSIVLQADGKIVAAGLTGGNRDYDFAIVRYNDDGSLDREFGSDGIVLEDFGGLNDYGRDIAIQRDGKIVVVGDAVSSADASPHSEELNADFGLVRYDSDGTVDIKVTTDFGGALGPSTDSAQAVAIQTDGRIVVGGYSSAHGSTDFDFAIARFDESGLRDTSFGVDGLVTSHLFSFTEMAQDLVIQADGKIVIVGGLSNSDPTNSDFITARYDRTGELDESFDGGWVTTNFAGRWDNPLAAAVQSDGKIVVVGVSSHAGFFFPFYDRYSALALARYHWLNEPQEEILVLV